MHHCRINVGIFRTRKDGVPWWWRWDFLHYFNSIFPFLLQFSILVIKGCSAGGTWGRLVVKGVHLGLVTKGDTGFINSKNWANNKIRITGLAAANAVGDKLPMSLIVKSKNHRCLWKYENITHVMSIPVPTEKLDGQHLIWGMGTGAWREMSLWPSG